MSEDLAVVSHQQDGRILSGVGADPHDLAETMDRHTPEDRQVEPAAVEQAPAPQAPDVAAASAQPEPTPEKPLTRGQKRFADLTREREDARREAAALRVELEQARSRPSSPGAVAAVPEPVRAAAPAEPTRAKPTEDMIGTVYQTYADFVEDLADYKAEQRQSAQTDIDARIRTAIEADRASRSFQESIPTMLDEGRKAYPDFDAVRASSRVGFPKETLAEIAKMPNRSHVVYQLAKDESLAILVSNVGASNPDQVASFLTRLFPASTDARPASSAQPSVTPPPAPYQPVQGGRPTTVTPSAERVNGSGYDYDKSGYREARKAERARAGR